MSRLGIFLLIAVRNPSANRSLIAFTADERKGFLFAVALFAVIGVTLIALAPARQSVEPVPAAGA